MFGENVAKFVLSFNLLVIRSVEQLKLIEMKKNILLLMSVLSMTIWASAQDDMYFKPQSQSKTASKIQKISQAASVTELSSNTYTDDEIDRYNRQGYYIHADTLYLGDGQQNSETISDSSCDVDEDIQYSADEYTYYDNDYCYSRRLARFYNPSISFSIGWESPFYWGSYDYYWDWYYGNGWYGYYPYDYYGWYRPWYNRWYDPWWGGRHYSYWRPAHGYVYRGPTGTRNHSYSGHVNTGRRQQTLGNFGGSRSVYGTFGSRSNTNRTQVPNNTTRRSTTVATQKNTNSPSQRNGFGGSRSTVSGSPATSPITRSSSPSMNRGGSFGGSTGGSFGGGSRGGSSGGGHFGGRR